MDWKYIPNVDNSSSSADDNPKQQPVGQISVNLPTDDWLWKKMERLNLTLVKDPEPQKPVAYRRTSSSRLGSRRTSATVWSVHSSHGVHGGGQTDSITKGYKNQPVPR